MHFSSVLFVRAHALITSRTSASALRGHVGPEIGFPLWAKTLFRRQYRPKMPTALLAFPADIRGNPKK
jgi:hypothetical protein